MQDLTYHPPLGESDHVSLEFNVCFTQVKDKITPGRNVYKTNYGAIKAELNQQVWEELLNSKFENDYDMFFRKATYCDGYEHPDKCKLKVHEKHLHDK